MMTSTMRSTATRALAVFLALGAAASAFTSTLVGCKTADPTQVVVENAYPEVADGGDPATQVVVYKVWWQVVLFEDPVLPGTSSAEQRGVPERETAFALLAPGWDPESGTPPTTLVPVKSKELLAAKRGDTLRITVSDATFTGNCAAQQPLTQEDADFITERIFPGDFAGVIYDAKTCTSTPIPADDAGPPDSAEAGD